jgi:hypothetical protein
MKSRAIAAQTSLSRASAAGAVIQDPHGLVFLVVAARPTPTLGLKRSARCDRQFVYGQSTMHCNGVVAKRFAQDALHPSATTPRQPLPSSD